MRRDIDLSRLSSDGVELEQLTRDLCIALGYRAAWSGKGPDGGRDLIVEEPGGVDFGSFPRKWLVSCKHTAAGGGSVGYSDVGDVPGRLSQHGCQGYLLVTTTQPSSGLIDAFEAWAAETSFLFYYWDAPALKKLLLRDTAQSVAQVFFAEETDAETSADSEESALAIVEQRTFADGMAHYVNLSSGRAFYFETRKEPHEPAVHLVDFALGFDHLGNRLPSFMSYAVRGVWYDDKHSSYLWRVDVAWPDGFSPELSVLDDRLSEVLVAPGNWGGQWHDFELRRVAPELLDPVTPVTPDEENLQLFGKWPDEPPVDYVARP